MNISKLWYLLLGISVALLLAFVFVFLGALLDVKYTLETIREVDYKVVELSYNHIYALSGIIVFQFFIILYLLVISKNKSAQL